MELDADYWKNRAEEAELRLEEVETDLRQTKGKLEAAHRKILRLTNGQPLTLDDIMESGKALQKDVARVLQLLTVTEEP